MSFTVVDIEFILSPTQLTAFCNGEITKPMPLFATGVSNLPRAAKKTIQNTLINTNTNAAILRPFFFSRLILSLIGNAMSPQSN